MHTNLCILIEMSVKIRMAKKNEGSYLSSVMNGEFYFRDADEVSKFDLGLLNAYNPMHFDRNIGENKDGKKNEGSYLSCVTVNSILGTLMILNAVAIPEMKNVQNLSLNWKKTSMMAWNCLVDVLQKMFQ